MANDSNAPQDNAIVEVVSERSVLAKEEMPDGSDEIKDKTLELIEAITSKARSEAQKAGDFTREKYLDAVSQAKEEIEQLNLFDPERIETAITQVRQEVDKDWDTIAKQITTLGDRLSEAAKAAWEVLTTPHSDSKS
jgi:hypothetical protein